METGSQSFPKLEEQVPLVVGKEPNAGDIRDMVSLGWEDPLEEGNPLQYSGLANPMDRRA